ncbi:TetR/AcrR family transcriptional regulator [Bailinhaonella thermotolerans]|uniref:TetR/AcrR family transcriptional regulator n=1 Tax=Bailinhaonella thermotolerans TaxID=1070861 RepID=UPI001F5B4E51|nr:TetR family transcriptional regulator C-terminal domain-containing protein [Bailinhaonella thermotolerans]
MRIVDTEERRRRVSQAVWEVMDRAGFAGLTMRAVAEAAGCTTGMVTHYFAGKREMLAFARARMHERMDARVRARDGLADVLEESLPLDAERRAETRVWLNFLVAALHDPDLAPDHVDRNRAWQDRIASLIAELNPALDASLEAQTLVSLTDGVATLAAADPGRFPPARQREILRHHLSRLLP